MGSSTLQAGLQWSLELFRKLGVRVPESGRHQAALKLLDRWNRSDTSLREADEANLLRVAAAHRTAWEACLIGCGAWRTRRQSDTPFLPAKLRQLMGGAEIYEQRRTQARDVQFELTTAAMLALGGVTVRRGEPDIRFLYGHEEVGIAAKRIRSLAARQIKKHVDDAVGQIMRSQRRGWIAINLDSRFASIAINQERGQLLRHFERTFDSLNPALRRHRTNKSILGVMAYGYLTDWTFGEDTQSPPKLTISAPFLWLGWFDDDSAERVLHDDFTDGWQRRFANSLQTMSNGRCE